MLFVVFIDKLNKALSLVGRIVSLKNQLPVLGNVLISAEKGEISLTTTNLETAITTKVPAVVEKEGKITVPVKQLIEIISLLKEEQVKISQEGNNLKIESKKSKNLLTTTPAEEFPPIHTKEGKENLRFDYKEFKKAIEQITIATSQDENRPVLGGVKLGKKDNIIEMATTDGYRLSVKEIKAEENSLEKSYIFPVRTLNEVARIATEQKAGVIKLLVLEDKKQAVFFFENTQVTSRLIEGEFPNFQKIVPASFVSRVVVDREEFLNAIKLTGIYARESANIVKIKIKEKSLTLSANAPQVGENEISLDIEREGEQIEVAFNYRFLLDLLSVIEDERIVFETAGPLNPGTFKIEKDPSFIHIIMPVRTQN